ncbi:Arc family DNA-binding protein [Rhizobium sp. SL86]|uniref:Arc family DNA-binding protein n=1 Tax=Rhizobium sp. SL86 TaxID=2995148 RepID=UPI003FA3A4F7
MIQQTRRSDKFPLRLSDGLREAIKRSATENGRSMNSEIVFRLTRAYELAQPETQKADATA